MKRKRRKGFYYTTKAGHRAHILGDVDMTLEALAALEKLIDHVATMSDEELQAIREKRVNGGTK